MPAANRIPSYCHHKSTDRAYVTIDGRMIYLAAYNSPESRKAYARLIGEWAGAGRQLPVSSEDITIVELCARFIGHAQAFYRRPDGTATSELDNFRQAIRPLTELYGDLPAREFGPLKLKALRSQMVARGWCRTNVNKQVGRIKMIIKWAVSNSSPPASVHQALATVAGLKRGRSEAKESERVVPVPQAHIDAVLPLVSPHVGAMIQLQLLTGARAGEIVRMTTGEIDRTGDVWTYSPAGHKTEHHGHERMIFLGKRAQQVIAPFLKLDPAAPVFSPADAERERRDAMHATRKTPLNTGNVPGTNRRRYPKRPPGASFTVASYRRAIARACDRADAWAKGGRIIGDDERIVPRWHPHRLRHNAGTELRRQFGIEAARTILGHRTLSVTAMYAERDFDAARRICAQVG